MSRASRRAIPTLLAVGVTLLACGGSTGERAEAGDAAEAAPAEAAPSAERRTAAAASDEASPLTVEPVALPLTPENAKRVVRSLIEAFQAGDRSRVESLWAADGGTWRDQAGFEERAAYYRNAEFDLDPASMQIAEHTGTIQVIVSARRDDADWVWSFLVTEIDGELRAGGAEASPAGLP